ncbi:MAG: N-acetyltransferase [Lewinellaceae bacterium]|nr:N-acetyltransferase [Lewinellaceae bacterium]
MSTITVVNNPASERFEVQLAAGMAIAEYKLIKNRLILTHTEVPVALEGQGIGSALARYALNFARERQLEVMPLCPYMAAYMSRHPETQDILMPGFRLP